MRRCVPAPHLRVWAQTIRLVIFIGHSLPMSLEPESVEGQIRARSVDHSVNLMVRRNGATCDENTDVGSNSQAATVRKTIRLRWAPARRRTLTFQRRCASTSSSVAEDPLSGLVE